MGQGAAQDGRTPLARMALRAFVVLAVVAFVPPSVAWAAGQAAASAAGKAAPHARRSAVIAMAPTFELQADGTSRFTVPLSGSVTVEETKSGNTVVYSLKGVRVPKRNDRNPLVTVFWNTPVDDARLKPDARGTKFVLRLRSVVAPSSRLVAAEAGQYVLEIVFPKGDYLPAGAAMSQASSEGSAFQESSSPKP